jgi:hypothetical protein
MCLHGKVQIESAVRRFEGDRMYAVLWIADKHGVPQYGWDCIPFKNTQEVSNTIRNLREWHPDAFDDGGQVDLSDINRKRMLAGLSLLDADGLPAPTGTAPPSSDRSNDETHMGAG